MLYAGCAGNVDERPNLLADTLGDLMQAMTHGDRVVEIFSALTAEGGKPYKLFRWQSRLLRRLVNALSSGHHAHVFLAADGGAEDGESITRLIVASPWAVDRRSRRRRGDQRLFEEVTGQLRELRAGRLGRFDHLMAEPVEDGDPLIGPTRTWVGKTPYVATRNLKKRDDPDAAVKSDVAAECVRRGLPAPTEIHVLDVSAGPRGGRPVAKLRLCFATALRGPLFLGRDCHTGGGLFHATLSE